MHRSLRRLRPFWHPGANGLLGIAGRGDAIVKAREIVSLVVVSVVVSDERLENPGHLTSKKKAFSRNRQYRVRSPPIINPSWTHHRPIINPHST